MIESMTKRMKNKKGFTLIELVVVIAILGILAAIAIPRLTGARDNASRTTVEANLRTIDSAIAIAEADGKLDENPTVEELVTNGYLAVKPVGPNDGTITAVYEIFDNDASATVVSWRAGVTFSAANGYGVTILVGPHTVDELIAMTTTGQWSN